VAAGIGGMVGFRIGDIATKTFAKAVGEVVAQRKLKEGRNVDFGAVVDAIKSVNKASLSAEAVGAVFGDLVGGSLGAAVGIALLAGATPFAVPLIGTVSAAYLGSKLGKAIGRGIGRWIGRKTLKKGYEAYAAIDREEGEEQQEAESDAGLVKIEDPEMPESNTAGTSAVAGGSSTAASNALYTDYQKAYREYTDAVTNPESTDGERKAALQRYREAYSAYQTAVSKTGN